MSNVSKIYENVFWQAYAVKNEVQHLAKKM
jgi:hypothetical protein